MSLIEILAIFAIAFLLVATFISEPKLSMQYFKAMTKSGIKIVKSVMGMVNKYRVKEVKNDTKVQGEP